jgi:hypothetical protein
MATRTLIPRATCCSSENIEKYTSAAYFACSSCVAEAARNFREHTSIAGEVADMQLSVMRACVVVDSVCVCVCASRLVPSPPQFVMTTRCHDLNPRWRICRFARCVSLFLLFRDNVEKSRRRSREKNLNTTLTPDAGKVVDPQSRQEVQSIGITFLLACLWEYTRSFRISYHLLGYELTEICLICPINLDSP